MFNLTSLFGPVAAKVRPPVAVVLGSPREAAELVALCPPGDVTCYQMDLHQAGRLREELAAAGREAAVAVHSDLWDLPPDFQTVLFPVARHGERELKLDLLEQSAHILRPGGLLLALSEYETEQLLPKALKKYFGKCHELPATREGSTYWAVRDKERPRRRHEVTFHARLGEGPSHTFVSRPGVFSYGRMDDGARALLEIAELLPGQSVLDLGCGVGTNGVLAADRTGADAPITFVDSNVRAVALTEANARANGLTNFTCLAAASLGDLPPASFDVVLANPPYYAASAIARMFIEGSRPLLKEGGRLFLVTKQVEHVAPFMVETFGDVDAFESRGYTVIEATKEATSEQRN
jgi:23S rRNA (guanine1835-N2)-methyltransferase